MCSIHDVKFEVSKISSIGELFFPMNTVGFDQGIELSESAVLGIHEILTDTAFKIEMAAQEACEYIEHLEEEIIKFKTLKEKSI